VAVTITGDRAVNLNLCLALALYGSEGPFTCNTYYYTTQHLSFDGPILQTSDSYF
jgi:hypothetical protein